VIAIRFAGQVGPAALRAMHQGSLRAGDESLVSLLREAGVASVRPVHNLSDAEISLGLAAARDFELTVAPGADEAHSARVLRESALVEDVSTIAPEAAPPLPGPPLAVPATAEDVATELVFAGFWLRFAAWIIDTVVLATASVFLVSLVGAMAGLAGFAVVALLVGPLVYYAALESNSPQATVGKMAVGIIVVDMEGHRLTAGRALGRNVAKVVTAFVPLGAGWMMAGFTEKKQALHDMIAGTLVVKKPR